MQEQTDYSLPFGKLIALQVEVSSACNLRCRQCFNHLDNHITTLFSRELWDRHVHPLLPQLKEISLVGIGEPLLCKDLFYFIADSKNHNLHIATTSNLQLLDEGLAEALVTSGLTELSFSCDGSRKETYEKIRINGTFERLTESLNLINKYKMLHKAKTPKLTLNFGAVRSNIEQLPGIVDFAHRNLVEQIIAYHYVSYYPDLKDESLFHHQELSDEMFSRAKSRANKLRIAMFLPGLFFDPILPNNNKRYCLFPFVYLYIYSDGRVGSCCMDFPERNILGDLKEKSLEEIWNDGPILKLRKELSTTPSQTCKYCVNHLKMNISDPRYFFRFKDSEHYIQEIEKRSR